MSRRLRGASTSGPNHFGVGSGLVDADELAPPPRRRQSGKSVQASRSMMVPISFASESILLDADERLDQTSSKNP